MNQGTNPNNGDQNEYQNMLDLHGVSEKEKLSEKWLKAAINDAINSCRDSFNKEAAKAYDIRNGVRNIEDFEHITKKYGVEFPAKLMHVPLIRKHIDALIGQRQLTPINSSVTCKDKKTLVKINQERQKGILAEIEERIYSQVSKGIKGQSDGSKQSKDPFSEAEMELIKKKYTTDWRSSFEINAQDTLYSVMQKVSFREMDSLLLEDILTTGTGYYQVKPLEEGRMPLTRVLNPVNIYYSKPSSVKYIKELNRVVYKEKMLIHDVINIYGERMKEEDKKKLEKRYFQAEGYQLTDMTLLSEAPKQDRENQQSMEDYYVDVYYVELKSNNKINVDENGYVLGEDGLVENDIKRKVKCKYRLDRYEGVRIGQDIYVDCGKSINVQRPIDNPYYCDLTINGVAYSDRNGKPYSLVMATKELQEKYDILHFHWENAVALSGNKAMLVPVENIPLFLGNSPTERIIGFQAMIKNGIAPISLSQDGAKDFSNYGQAINMSLDNSISVIIDMLKFLEETASNITGVSRQSLSNISERDGKGNTEAAITRSAVITQPLFSTHQELIRQFLTDILNASRTSLKAGSLGSYMLGETEQKIFTIGNEFPMSDYDVYISDSTYEKEKIEQMQAMATSLIESQMIDVEQVIDIMTIKSLTELKFKIKESVALKKQDQLQQMQQQIQEYEKQMQQMQKQIEGSQKQNQEAENQKLQMEAKKNEDNNKLRESEIKNQKDFNDAKLELEERRVELEAMQLSYGTKDANKSVEIKNK